jgi:glycosyltransferase involved in cell wall biosynthesis
MVGYTVWETDRLPLHWPPLLQGYDLILTPSTFSRNVLAHHTKSPVVVVPHLPRTDWPIADAESLAAFRRRFAIEREDFVFYTVNTWLLRKALWLTLHAYLLAFAESDPVVLFIKTASLGEVDGVGWRPTRMLFEQVLANYPDPARVVFVPDELRHEDMGLLHLAGDAYVSLTRSEGFGVGAFDAATAGTPVVMTGWSGQLDFLPAQHACLVDYELRQVTERLGNHPYQEQHWAHADVDHAIEWMRRLFQDRGQAQSRGAGLKTYIAAKYNTEAITQGLLETLDG